jgi:hypothetical protein
MSDERVNEIEDKIARGELTAAQVFTQMRQLIPAARAQQGEGREAAMDDAEGGPLPCPFCGQEPHRMPHPDPTYPQVQCRNIECPIGINGEEVSLESWNIRAHPPKAQGVPEIVVKALRIAMHHWMKDGVESADEEDATFCDSVLQELLLSTTPPADKPEGEACPECGSTDVSWHCHTKVNGAAPDGRLRAHEVDAIFVLGCNYCSETIDIKTSEEIAASLTRPAAPDMGGEK